MKIENDTQLAEAKRDIETFERYGVYQSLARRLRDAIAEYERNRDDARVAEIAAGLSDKAKARLVFLGAGENSIQAVRDACGELLGKQLEELSSIATPLGLKVLAEYQKCAPLPERWGVFGSDYRHMLYCECLNPADAEYIVKVLLLDGLSTHVRKI